MFHRLFLLLLITPLILTSAQGAEQKLSISAETFGQLANYGSITLSPSGKRLASLRNHEGKISLVTQSLDPAEKGQAYVSTYRGGRV